MTPAIIKQAEHLVRANSPAILTALGVSGTLTTAYLTHRAAFEAYSTIQWAESESLQHPDHMTTREKVDLVWRLYIPAGLTSAATVLCIVGASKVGSRRTAAVVGAYSLSEKAFSEYKEKVVEKLGEKKELEVRDEIVQDRITANPPSSGLVVAAAGEVLCYEFFTGRYFISSMEALKQAKNEVNAKLLRNDTACLSDFYDLIGLENTSGSWFNGWASDKLMDLEFSAALSPEGKPCISFDYNYMNPL